MKIRKLQFQSKEIVLLDSSSDEDVICLDDLPKKRRKITSSETCGEKEIITIKIFATAKPDFMLNPLSNVVEIGDSTEKTVEITQIKCLTKQTLIQESNYFRALFSTKYLWRETNKNTIEIEVPGLSDIDLLGEERAQVENIGGCEYVAKLEAELLTKAVNQFFDAFIMMELEITAKNMFVYHRLSDFFLLNNFTLKIEEFIISKIGISKIDNERKIKFDTQLTGTKRQIASNIIALYNFNPLLCHDFVPKSVFNELNVHCSYHQNDNFHSILCNLIFIE